MNECMAIHRSGNRVLGYPNRFRYLDGDMPMAFVNHPYEMGQVVEPDHIAYFRYLFLRVFQQFASGVQAVLRDELREGHPPCIA